MVPNDAPADTLARARLAQELLPYAEQLVAEFADKLPADAVVRCLEAAMGGALLMRLEGDDAVTATVSAAREDCAALVEATQPVALAG
jgi:hypothetical protein